jgi:hypothetical protein
LTSQELLVLFGELHLLNIEGRLPANDRLCMDGQAGWLGVACPGDGVLFMRRAGAVSSDEDDEERMAR